MPENRKVKIFVGSDPYMKKAEMALEYSIKKHISQPYEIIWMDYSRGEPWTGWKSGARHYEYFRFAIPEICHFKERAIYINVEMLFVGDVAELFNYPMTHAVYLPPRGIDVMLIDCAAFKNLHWWPTIEEMKSSDRQLADYTKILEDHHLIGRKLPTKWECMNGMGYDPDYTCAIHFANLKTQPWKPYPDLIEYVEPSRSEIAELWWQHYKEALNELLV